MGKCGVCNEKIGFFQQWEDYEDEDGNSLRCCMNCNKKRVKEEKIKESEKKAFEKQKAEEENHKQEEKKKKYHDYLNELDSKETFPSHDELYKHLEDWKTPILLEIFNQLGYTFKTDYETEFEVEIKPEAESFEEWDLLFTITKTPEESLQKEMKKLNFDHYILVEYKSNINEHGESIGECISEFKERDDYEDAIILSFDPEFEEYKSAFKSANIKLIVIPFKKIIDWIKNNK